MIMQETALISDFLLKSTEVLRTATAKMRRSVREAIQAKTASVCLLPPQFLRRLRKCNNCPFHFSEVRLTKIDLFSWNSYLQQELG